MKSPSTPHKINENKKGLNRMGFWKMLDLFQQCIKKEKLANILTHKAKLKRAALCSVELELNPKRRQALLKKVAAAQSAGNYRASFFAQRHSGSPESA